MTTVNAMIPVIPICVDCRQIMGYKLMVDNCWEIIPCWPDSKYGFGTKRALADLAEQYHKMYNITKEELTSAAFTGSWPVQV